MLVGQIYLDHYSYQLFFFSQAIATDIDAFKENLDSTLFPGVPSSVEVHSGFANEQAKFAHFSSMDVNVYQRGCFCHQDCNGSFVGCQNGYLSTRSQ